MQKPKVDKTKIFTSRVVGKKSKVDKKKYLQAEDADSILRTGKLFSADGDKTCTLTSAAEYFFV